ncbi:MAG: hypothetical protein ISS19_08220 [Bacteroidales bacterium]|nr:hypothetical protein [Bacteroidales bacterium]
MPKQLPSKSPLAASLLSLSRETLENLLSDLYEKFDIVRNFIDLKMTGNSDPLLKKYKKPCQIKPDHDFLLPLHKQ